MTRSEHRRFSSALQGPDSTHTRPTYLLWRPRVGGLGIPMNCDKNHSYGRTQSEHSRCSHRNHAWIRIWRRFGEYFRGSADSMPSTSKRPMGSADPRLMICIYKTCVNCDDPNPNAEQKASRVAISQSDRRNRPVSSLPIY